MVEAEFKDPAGETVFGACEPTLCPEPVGTCVQPDGFLCGEFVYQSGTSQGKTWELKCNASYYVTGGSGLAVCEQNGELFNPSYCQPGGCNSSLLEATLLLPIRG